MAEILIAEDERELREVLTDYFISRADAPTAVGSGDEALEAAMERRFDAVLLDIMMPGLDGYAVCRALRKNSDAPIIFLTALGAEEDKLYGYELGADDYITKPFSLSVLYAKVQALIRRSRGDVRSADTLRAGDVELTLSSRTVKVKGKETALTPKEYALLKCLMENRNAVLSREQLLVQCWGWDYEGDARAVDTHIRRLRSKLGESGKMITTVIKAGYRLEVKG